MDLGQNISGKINYKQAVLSTLAFFDQFDHPLTKEETTHHLFNLKPDDHLVEIALTESNLIRRRGHTYQLNHDRDLAPIRHHRELISAQLWKKVEKYRWVFSLTPYVRMVGICNTLATDNADEGSDIDLFVVVEPGKLFVSRLLLTFWMQILGVRRHGKKVAGRFCLSFFVTEDHLSLESIQKGPIDIYLAYWIKTLVPVYGSNEIHSQFLTANEKWLKNFFTQPADASPLERLKPGPKWTERLKTLQEKILNTRWGKRLENRLATWQIERAERKQKELGLPAESSAVIVSRTMLKFHNTDRREVIYRQWIETLQAFLKR